MTQTIYQLSIGDKVLIGRTKENVKTRVKNHEELLIQGKHFNKIMQLEYDKNPHIEYSIIHKDVPIKDANKLFVEEINEKESYNAFKGFNNYLDKKIRKSKTYKPENSPEDIIFHYLDNGVYTKTQEEFGINYVSLIYHLNKYGVMNKSKPTIPSKKDMVYAGIQILVQADKPLTSSQIVERVYNEYNVANKINFSSRQMSIPLKSSGAVKVGKSPVSWVAP
jgi:predicted acetyltransferase